MNEEKDEKKHSGYGATPRTENEDERGWTRRREPGHGYNKDGGNEDNSSDAEGGRRGRCLKMTIRTPTTKRGEEYIPRKKI